jgi:hypothetical protein
VTLGFSVTANPPTSGNVLMVREIRDTFSPTDVRVRQDTAVLVNGIYRSSIFTSGTLSFVREIRFTLDTATCSLFWNINP